MNLKYFSVLLILLILFSIGVVSAADDTEDVVVSSDSAIQNIVEDSVSQRVSSPPPQENLTSQKENVSDSLEVEGSDTPLLGSSSSNDTLCATDDGSFTALQARIDAVAIGGVVTLENNYAFSWAKDVNLVDGVVISKSITIEGNGKTIDGKSAARIFYIGSANAWGSAVSANLPNVVLKNIRFQGGYRSSLSNETHGSINGGAILWRGDKGVIDSCTFYNNRVYRTNSSGTYVGGSFYWSGNGLLIKGTTFSTNWGTGTSMADYGSYFYTDGHNVNITGCDFGRAHLVTYSSGGLFYIHSASYKTWENLSITNSRFHDATDTNNMGTYITSEQFGTIECINNTFINVRGRSGVLRLSGTDSTHRCHITVKDCIFNNTAASYEGPAALLGIGGGYANITIVNNVFENNRGGYSPLYLYAYGSDAIILFENNTINHIYGSYEGIIRYYGYLGSRLNFYNNYVTGVASTYRGTVICGMYQTITVDGQVLPSSGNIFF